GAREGGAAVPRGFAWAHRARSRGDRPGGVRLPPASRRRHRRGDDRRGRARGRGHVRRRTLHFPDPRSRAGDHAAPGRGRARVNLLVVGGAGYIGSVVAEELVRGRHSVLVLDDLSTGHRDAVPPLAYLVKGHTA